MLILKTTKWELKNGLLGLIQDQLCLVQDGYLVLFMYLQIHFISIMSQIWVFPKIWGNPQIIHFNRVFHEINHPFCGIFPYGSKPISSSQLRYACLNGRCLSCGFDCLASQVDPRSWEEVCHAYQGGEHHQNMAPRGTQVEKTSRNQKIDFLGGGNSNIFHFHPEIWGRFPIWLIFFKRVETTN